MKYLFVAGCIFLSACTTGLGGAKITNLSVLAENPNYEMKGILQQAENCKPDISVQCNINIFYIHGMGRTSTNFQSPLLDHLLTLENLNFKHRKLDDRPVFLSPKFNNLEIRGEVISDIRPCSNLFDPTRCQFGKLLRDVYSGTINGIDVDVNSYALYWEGDAWERVQQGYIQNDIDTIQTESVWVNKLLKETVVDYGFSDAALYLGDFGKVLRYSTETAICIMVREAIYQSANDIKDTNSCDLASLSDARSLEAIRGLNLTFVSKSLGSRIFMDSILPLNELNSTYEYSRATKTLNPNMTLEEVTRNTIAANSEEVKAIQTKKAVAQSLSASYMLANQLPLLGIGTLEVENSQILALRDSLYCRLILESEEDDCQSPLLFADDQLPKNIDFFTFIENVSDLPDVKKVTDRKMDIYAFRDPNDLLGFQATQHLSARNISTQSNPYRHLTITEISHRNAREWLWSFSNPKSAHANEDRGAQSLALIWCGGVAASNGKLDAKDCP